MEIVHKTKDVAKYYRHRGKDEYRIRCLILCLVDNDSNDDVIRPLTIKLDEFSVEDKAKMSEF